MTGAALLRRLAAALTAACCLSCGSLALAAKAPELLAVDASFQPAEMAAKVLAVSDTTTLKGITRVAVPLFAVEFVTADQVSASTSGFAAAGRARSSLYYKLLGVGEADFQAITDALYADFLRDLAASGLEVVAPEQVQASPAYSKLASSGSVPPIRSDSAITLAPPGLAVYGFAKSASGGNNGGVFGAIASIGSNMAAVGSAFDAIELSKELGASLIEVQMRVNFVQLTDNNRGFLGRISGTASATGKVNPSIGSLLVSVQNGPARSAVTMKNTLTLDSAAFSEVREKAASAGDIAGSVAVGLLRMAIGSSDSSSSSEMEAVADPVRYREVVGAGLGTVRQMLVVRLAQER
ncbi:MAG: hypothetical protein ABI564_11540 [Ideonella sp.]